YSDQSIRVGAEKPVAADSRIETVRIDVLQPGKPAVAVDFKLVKNKKTGQWKVYDIIGEGISLLSSKQSEWQGKIRQQGIASVSAEMASLAKASIKRKEAK
ncbi:MAG: MlaC/ttg2D family ABC transporter substrate-binding protein, partial [Vibrio sp.]